MIGLLLAVTTAVTQPPLSWDFQTFTAEGAKYNKIEGYTDWDGKRLNFGVDASIFDSATKVGLPVRINCYPENNGYFCIGVLDEFTFRLKLGKNGSGTIGQIRTDSNEVIDNRHITFSGVQK